MSSGISDVRELLSAAMDGELGKLELRRLLKAIENDAELAADWSRMHTARALLRKDHSSHNDLDISMGVLSAIQSDQKTVVQSANSESNWRQSLGGVMVAASMAMVVFIGWQAYQPSPVAQKSVVNLEPAATRPPQGRIQVNGVEGQSELASQRLNEYFLKHSQNNLRNTPKSVIDFTRIVVQPSATNAGIQSKQDRQSNKDFSAQ